MVKSENIAKHLLENSGTEVWLDTKAEISKFLESMSISEAPYSQESAAEKAEEILASVNSALRRKNESDIRNNFGASIEVRTYNYKITKRHFTETKCAIDVLTGTGFEDLCTELVKQMGGKATRTGKTGDQGVDFQGLELPLGTHFETMPINLRPVLLGQAKRYSSSVREPEVREFMSGALLRARELQKDRGMFIPVVFAFWTSNELDARAQDACKEFGIWYLDGTRIAIMCEKYAINPRTYQSEDTDNIQS